MAESDDPEGANLHKRGGQSPITVNTPYLYPDIVQLSIRYSKHPDVAGKAFHVCAVDAQGVKVGCNKMLIRLSLLPILRRLGTQNRCMAVQLLYNASTANQNKCAS